MEKAEIQLKKTSLNDRHQQLGARMVDFNGWSMPVHYRGIREEHQAVRQAVGLFDISHMGTLVVTGHECLAFLQKMFPNDLSSLPPGKALYTQMCNASGGILDDLIVYRLETDRFQLVVNAGNRDKDWEWLVQHKPANVELQNLSPNTTILALQGPHAVQLASELSNIDLNPLPPFHITSCELQGVSLLAGRTGYTGEDGLELYVPAEQSGRIWDMLLEAGQKYHILPIGLGARDTLRLEAGLPLYGHDLDEATTPLEAGLGWSVKLNKKEGFIGKPALMGQKEHGISRKRVGFRMCETRRAPREGYFILFQGETIGHVTSGTLSPTLNIPIGMGYVDTVQKYTTIEIEIREQRHEAEIMKIPFYRRSE